MEETSHVDAIEATMTVKLADGTVVTIEYVPQVGRKDFPVELTVRKENSADAGYLQSKVLVAFDSKKYGIYVEGVDAKLTINEEGKSPC